jgi:chemotaxis protein methyltransferase CheR/two-component system CheB/CheR fusion protein
MSVPYFVHEVLSFLTERFGEDFLAYSPLLTERRISERATHLGFADGAAYADYLYSEESEPARFVRMLRVRHSSFFREPLQFELLASCLVPSMIRAGAENASLPLRAWSAACAGGEEVWSLAILLDEAFQSLGLPPRAQIFGTDVAVDAIEEARLGIYPRERLDGLTLKRFHRYFSPRGDVFCAEDSLRGMISFSVHDMLEQNTYVPPESIFGGFDLVLCRNFLMYLDTSAYRRVFDKLFRALKPGGVLLLGMAETPPDSHATHLEKLFDCGHLYRKKPGWGRY